MFNILFCGVPSVDCAKDLRRALRKNSWAASAWTKSKVSLAYCSIGKSIPGIGRGACRRPKWNALLIICCKSSAAITNNKGERGSPCLTPLLHLNSFLETPFKSTEEDAVVNNILIHLSHLCGNPRLSIIKRIEECSTVSKALAKSSLRIKISFLDWWHWCMYWKDQARQSWIVLFLINPYWLRCISSRMTSCNLSAKILVMILMMLFRR